MMSWTIKDARELFIGIGRELPALTALTVTMGVTPHDVIPTACGLCLQLSARPFRTSVIFI
jgi:hypothetical protein